MCLEQQYNWLVIIKFIIIDIPDDVDDFVPLKYISNNITQPIFALQCSFFAIRECVMKCVLINCECE